MEASGGWGLKVGRLQAAEERCKKEEEGWASTLQRQRCVCGPPLWKRGRVGSHAHVGRSLSVLHRVMLTVEGGLGGGVQVVGLYCLELAFDFLPFI